MAGISSSERKKSEFAMGEKNLAILQGDDAEARLSGIFAADATGVKKVERRVGFREIFLTRGMGMTEKHEVCVALTGICGEGVGTALNTVKIAVSIKNFYAVEGDLVGFLCDNTAEGEREIAISLDEKPCGRRRARNKRNKIRKAVAEEKCGVGVGMHSKSAREIIRISVRI